MGIVNFLGTTASNINTGENDVTRTYVDVLAVSTLNSAKKYTDEQIDKNDDELKEKTNQIIEALTITRI